MRLRHSENCNSVNRSLQTIYDVVSAYFDVVRQKQELVSVNEALNFNKERVKIAEAGLPGWFAGKNRSSPGADRPERYHGKCDQPAVCDRSFQKGAESVAGPRSGNGFEVTDSITVSYSPDKDELLQLAGQSNLAILSYRKQLDIAGLSLKEYRRSSLPVLNFRAGYYLSRSNNPYGTVLNNLTYGPGISGTLSIPLYGAGENKRLEAGAKTRLNSAGYALEDITLKVNTTC